MAYPLNKSRFKQRLLILLCIVFIALLIRYPQAAIDSAKNGLKVWYNSVLPAIFPFIVGANLLITLGAATLFGRLLEPVMAPLFNVPGCGALAWLMGTASGYPLGAKITSDLRLSGNISKTQAERLISFTNNSGPLFIIGFVGVSTFGNPQIGYFILAINFIASVSTGLLMRFYKAHENRVGQGNRAAVHSQPIAPIGKILGESITNAIDTVVQVGGFIVLFCVIIGLMEQTGVSAFLLHCTYPLFNALGIHSNTAQGFLNGIFEFTNGIAAIGASNGDPMHAIILCGALVAFGGIAITCQSLAFIAKTDINPLIYIVGKIMHSILWILYALLLYPLLQSRLTVLAFVSWQRPYVLNTAAESLGLLLLSVLLLICLGKVVTLARRRRHSSL